MEITTEQYSRIQHFLDTEMTIEEMDAFEIELEANPHMRSQLDFEQSIRDNFSSQQTDSSIINSKKILPINNRKKWFGIAAAASVFVAIATIFFWNSKKNTPTPIAKKIDTIKVEKIDKIDSPTLPKVIPNKIGSKINFAQLFEEYFEPDKAPETYHIQLADAFTEYEKGNYNTLEKLDAVAIANTRGIDDKQNILETLHYYKGIAFLKTNNNDQALLNLQWVLQNSSNDTLKANANWYLALANLKNKNKSEAKKILERLSSYSKYKTQVEKLLEKFKE